MQRKKFFTTGEVSELLDISRATVSRKFDMGHLTGKKNPITGERLINYESLIAFMKKYHMSVADLERFSEKETDNKYILLASVDEELQNLVESTFSDDDRICITIVTTVYDALINCSKNQPDMFFIDEDMPGISCKDAVRSIKKNEELEDIKILCCLKQFDQVKVSEIEADNYIAKDMLENLPIERKKALIGYMFGSMTGDEATLSRYEKLYNEIIKPESSAMFYSKLENDFNNAFSSITGNISILKNFSDNSKFLEIINDIEISSNYIRSLSYELFTVFNNVYPIKNIYEVIPIIKEAVDFALINSGIQSEYSFDENLWKVEADKALIILSLNNIVKNAIEAMPQGGVLKVSASNIVIGPKEKSTVKKGEYVSISITDQGEGIPQENIPKIFNRYFSTKANSSGLGLSSASSIINKHEGYILVESTVGEGTTLTVYLKAVKDSITSIQEDKNEEVLPSLKILLMDDQEQIRKTSERIFNYLEQKIKIVNSGENAVEEYKRAMDSGEPYDFGILDIIVPYGIDGNETARQIIEFDKNAVLVASTGNIFKLENLEKNYFRGVLQKPYGIKEAKELIKSLF